MKLLIVSLVFGLSASMANATEECSNSCKVALWEANTTLESFTGKSSMVAKLEEACGDHGEVKMLCEEELKASGYTAGSAAAYSFTGCFVKHVDEACKAAYRHYGN